MNELQVAIDIEEMIYEVRGKQVMLDSDLAKLYHCINGTKTINQAVKRHAERFPERFMFRLTTEEFKNLQSQVGTANFQKVRTTPFAFTEQGVAMLATILRTNVAAQVSIQIMDAFVAMRKYISNNLISINYIHETLLKHDNRITLLEKSFSKFEEKKIVNEIYFNGQIYDAYSKIIDILREAKKELIIIDAYADKSTLDIIKNLNLPVTLIINERSKITKLDITKYNEQYTNLRLIYDNTYHDRYFILDKEIIYHSGTSINNAGSKTFSINRLEDAIVIKSIIKNLNEKGV